MSLVDATILKHLEATTRDLMKAEASAEVAKADREQYERTRDAFAPVLRDKYPEREDITKQIASAYKKAMRPWILSPEQMQQYDENRRVGTKTSRAANNLLVNRVGYAWNKIMNSIYEDEGSDDEGEETDDHTPLKKKQKVQNAIEVLKSCTPELFKEILDDFRGKEDILSDVRKLFEM